MKNYIAVGFFIGVVLAFGVNTMIWRAPGPAVIKYCESLLEGVDHG